MRIGIITFHCAHNYGAVLQAYALQEQIKILGHDAEVIDYRPKYITSGYEKSIFFYRPYNSITRKLLSFVKMVLCVSKRRILEPKLMSLIKNRRRGFSDFTNTKLNLSKNKYIKSFNEHLDYDYYIIGSDQVWNIDITNGFDPVYWGNFSVKSNARIITYAASMSKYDLNEKQKEIIKYSLSNFFALSVREKDLKDFLSNNFNIKTEVVFDPSLLVGSEVWRKIAKVPTTEEKYVLIYSMGGVLADELRVANKIAVQMGASVKVLLGDSKDFEAKYALIATSPEEFLGWFQNASFVVTSSFHGTAFSISYNKPFYSLARGSDKDTRQTTILNNLGLGDRFISKECLPDFVDIDYFQVNEKLHILQENSLNFLKRHIIKL